MKAADVFPKRKLHKTATKILSCILVAHARIDDMEKKKRDWLEEFFYSKEWCDKNIATHKSAIVKLESYYHKIVSQL